MWMAKGQVVESREREGEGVESREREGGGVESRERGKREGEALQALSLSPSSMLFCGFPPDSCGIPLTDL